jgi:hypothetical protein
MSCCRATHTSFEEFKTSCTHDDLENAKLLHKKWGFNLGHDDVVGVLLDLCDSILESDIRIFQWVTDEFNLSKQDIAPPGVKKDWTKSVFHKACGYGRQDITAYLKTKYGLSFKDVQTPNLLVSPSDLQDTDMLSWVCGHFPETRDPKYASEALQTCFAVNHRIAARWLIKNIFPGLENAQLVWDTAAKFCCRTDPKTSKTNAKKILEWTHECLEYVNPDLNNKAAMRAVVLNNCGIAFQGAVIYHDKETFEWLMKEFEITCGQIRGILHVLFPLTCGNNVPNHDMAKYLTDLLGLTSINLFEMGKRHVFLNPAVE